MAPKSGEALASYVRDAGQRWILFLETLCRRGDACIAREKETFKSVLAFDYDMVIDGRTLERMTHTAPRELELLFGLCTAGSCSRRTELRDSLTRTATGKLQKFLLRQPYWEGREKQIN